MFSVIWIISSNKLLKFKVKLSVALTLIGGVSTVTNSTKIRGESHMLIVGDPGTGKSQVNFK